MRYLIVISMMIFLSCDKRTEFTGYIVAKERTLSVKTEKKNIFTSTASDTLIEKNKYFIHVANISGVKRFRIDKEDFIRYENGDLVKIDL